MNGEKYMDSGNMSEMQDEVIQPDDVVVTESEATEATPQAEATEETELYIDDEGDQQEKPKDERGMTATQEKAAWRQEREKRKRKNAEIEAFRKENEELKQRLERAEKLAIEAAMGKKPVPSDFLDAQDYHDALEAYNQKQQEYNPKPQTQQEKPAQALQLSEDQEFHAYKSREELRKHFNDFDDAEKEVFDWVSTVTPNSNPEAVKAGVIALTHLHGIDYAKAVYAIKKIPALKDRLASAPNQMAIMAIMKEAASKIKTRQPVKIDSKPEPTLSSTGSVDATHKELEKARAEYAKDPSIANFKKVSAVKKKLNIS